MSMQIDLHIHTTASDGTLTPRETVAHAKRLGLKAIAITDHDTVAGIKEAQLAGEEFGVEVIAGVELSVEGRAKMHMLGLGIKLDNPGAKPLLDKLAELKEGRIERVIKAVSKLNECEAFINSGIRISFEDVEKVSNGASMGKPHIAEVIVSKGLAKDINNACELFLDKGRHRYVERDKITPEEAIKLIHDAGGKSIIAHPGKIKRPPEEIKEIILDLKKKGLNGIEVYYSDYTEETTRDLLKFAKEHDLIISGGSDFHGSVKPQIQMGSGRGNLCIGSEVLKGIKSNREIISR